MSSIPHPLRQKSFYPHYLKTRVELPTILQVDALWLEAPLEVFSIWEACNGHSMSVRSRVSPSVPSPPGSNRGSISKMVVPVHAVRTDRGFQGVGNHVSCSGSCAFNEESRNKRVPATVGEDLRRHENHRAFPEEAVLRREKRRAIA